MEEVRFKSTPDNWNKEKLGIKNNTVRYIDDDSRFNKIYAHSKDSLNGADLVIIIENTETGETFERKVIDVTYFEDNYVILTWDCLNQIKETHKLKEGNNYIIEMVPDACERS